MRSVGRSTRRSRVKDRRARPADPGSRRATMMLGPLVCGNNRPATMELARRPPTHFDCPSSSTSTSTTSFRPRLTLINPSKPFQNYEESARDSLLYLLSSPCVHLTRPAPIAQTSAHDGRQPHAHAARRPRRFRTARDAPGRDDSSG
jgi:hypothetical protein